MATNSRHGGARTGDPCINRSAQETGKNAYLEHAHLTRRPGKMLRLVALSDRGPHRTPGRLSFRRPSCITDGYPYGQYRPAQWSHLVRESGPVRRALSLGPGYRNLTGESGQGRRLARRASRPSVVCAFHLENGDDEDLPIIRRYRYRRNRCDGSTGIRGIGAGGSGTSGSMGSCGSVREWRQLEGEHG